MTNKIVFIIFWIVFAVVFMWLFIPKLAYLFNGFPDYLALNTTIKKTIFTTHIVSGVVVYITAFLQFAPFIRNKNIPRHRKIGRIYVTSALVCIVSVYYLIWMGKNAGLPFWPSQYTVASLWLLFIASAIYFARSRKIVWHRRLMLSGFICAAYFVTVRIIDRFFMDVFKYLMTNESLALLISDIFVWAFPLTLCWSYWLLWTPLSRNRRDTPKMPKINPIR